MKSNEPNRKRKKQGLWILAAALLLCVTGIVVFALRYDRVSDVLKSIDGYLRNTVSSEGESGSEWSHERDLHFAMGVKDSSDLDRIWGTRMDGEKLTLEDVIRLSAKGSELSWEDFDGYAFLATGSGLMINVYPVNRNFSVWMGGGGGGAPMYIYLCDNATEERIDIREADVETFIAQHGGYKGCRQGRMRSADRPEDAKR